LSIVAAAVVAVEVSVATPVLRFALQAAVIYRVEIAAAAFLGLYLVAMAFALALNNRGFSEIGMSGLKAQDLAQRGQQRTFTEHEKALESVDAMVTVAQSSIEDLEERVGELEEESEREQGG
jgi:peptidoglycan hydrolase CwlO-like protein